MEDRCVCCGEIIPEGTWVCPNCLVCVKKNTVLIRVTKAPEGVFPEYWPEIGKVYEAEYVPVKVRGNSKPYNSPFGIVNIRDKRIILRKDEFEIVGGSGNED